MDKTIGKTLNNALLCIGTAHYLACTVRIIQTAGQPYIWAILALSGIVSLVSGYALIRSRGVKVQKEAVDVLPVALFGCCVIVIPLILLIRGGN